MCESQPTTTRTICGGALAALRGLAIEVIHVASIAGLLSLPTDWAQAGEMDMARVSQPVDLKAQPQPDAASVVRAEPGDLLPIVGQQDGWFQVQLFHDSYY